MTKSWNPSRGERRYERAGSIALNTVTLRQAPLSLDKIRWRHRRMWLLAALVVVIGAVTLWLGMDSRFYVYEAEVVGARRLSYEDIFEASGLRGLHIFWARPGGIESRILEALPALERVEATCGLPASCTIAVVERRPRVLWDDGEEVWWIDEEGAVFPAQAGEEGAIDADGTSTHWTVFGPLPRADDGDYLDDRVRVALAELWKSGRELPGVFQYDRVEGLKFEHPDGWWVIVGKGPGMELRLRVLERVVAYLESREQSPRFVDVRFPEAPYYVPLAD